MKRLTALLLTMLMLLATVPFAVFAAEGELVGDSVLLAPPVGKVSAVTYELRDASGNPIPDAALSLQGAPAGITARDGKLYISGASVKAGSFTVTADGGGITASKTVTMSDVRIYDDFESLSAGDTIGTDALTLKKLDGTSLPIGIYQNSGAVVAEEANGNKYSKGKLSTLLDTVGISRSAKRLTISMDLKFDANWQTGIELTAGDGAGSRAFANLYRKRLTETYWTSYRKYDGTDGEIHNWGSVPPSANWTQLSVTLDLFKGTYVYRDKDTVLFKDASQSPEGIFSVGSRVISADMWLYQLTSEANIDNLAIYSGVDATNDLVPMITANVPEIVAVSQTKDSLFPITADVSYLGGGVSWNSDNAGVTVDGGFLRVAAGTAPGNVKLTATSVYDAGVTADYTVTVTSAYEAATADSNIGISAAGRILLTGKVSGSGTVTFAGNDTLAVDIPQCDDAELIVYINSFDNSYEAYANRQKIAKGTTNLSILSSVSLSGVSLTDAYVGSLTEILPLPVNVKIDGIVAGDQNVKAVWEVFSPCGTEATSSAVAWSLSATETGAQTPLGNKVNQKIDNDKVGQYLTLSVTLTSAGGATRTVLPAALIRTILSVSKTNGGVALDILNPYGDTTLVPFVLLYKDGKVTDVQAVKIKTADTDIHRELSITESYDGLAAFVLNEKFAAVTGVVSMGSVPNLYQTAAGSGLSIEGDKLTVAKNERTAVLILRPAAAGSFVSAAEQKQLLSSITAQGGSVFDTVAFADVLDSKVSFRHGLTEGGLYRLSAVTPSGTEDSLLFGVNLALLFASDELQNGSESFFKTIFGQLTQLTDAKLTKLYRAYHAIGDKDKAGTWFAGENFDMNKLEAVIYLVAFLEEAGYKDEVTAAFTALNLDTEAIALFSVNAHLAEAGKAVEWKGTLSATNDAMRPTAILQGVYRAAHYKETDHYLSALHYDKYNSAKDKAKIQTAVCGQLYADEEALKKAVDAALGTSQSSSGGSSGSGSRGNGSGKISVSGVADRSNVTNHQPSANFSDVSEEHWAYRNIAYLCDKKVLSGMEDGSFAPDKSITRAEYVKILCLAFPVKDTDEVKSFEDVANDAWYYDYVVSASKAGIITGDGNRFNPNDKITRQDAAVMLYRTLIGLNAVFGETELDVTDTDSIAPYAKEAVKALYGKDIIKGFDDGSFMPEADITRAQAAAIVARVLQ